MNKNSKHYYITGQVQGVCYRAFVQDYAKHLNITGWVRNLQDGRVEMLACGTNLALNEFETWLKQGPELAQVDNITAETIPYQEHTEFIITS